MKRIALFLTLGLGLAPVAAAQQNPDYSKETLLELFAGIPEKEDLEPRIEYGVGTIAFKALGTRWKIAYLPFFMPLSGTRMTPNKDWPDPFLLTGTQYASPPRTWRRGREMSAELRGIERRLRKNAKVVVKVE